MQLRVLLSACLVLFLGYLWVGNPMFDSWPSQLTTLLRQFLHECQHYRLLVTLAGTATIGSLFMTYQKIGPY